MKKVVSAVLSFVLLFSVGSVASAADINQASPCIKPCKEQP